MPYSYPMYKDLVAKHIRAKLRAFDNVLDVGCGCGTYAQLLSGIEMDGCEIYEPYVGQAEVPKSMIFSRMNSSIDFSFNKDFVFWYKKVLLAEPPPFAKNKNSYELPFLA